jgi:hypothetical protein
MRYREVQDVQVHRIQQAWNSDHCEADPLLARGLGCDRDIGGRRCHYNFSKLTVAGAKPRILDEDVS